MKTGLSLGDGVVARSLKIGRSTDGLVATVNAAVAANAMVAMPLVGSGWDAVLIAVVFFSVMLSTLTISKDLLDRSSQTVAGLKSIGATGTALSLAILGAILAYGALGSALGAGLGGTLGVSMAKGGFGASFGADLISVVVTAAVATGAGVYAGARMAWRS